MTACLVSAAEAARDSGPLHDQADLEDASARLTEKLQAGEAVFGCTFRDLLDCEINSDRYQVLLDELDTLLRRDGGSDTVEGYASTLRDKIIERFLDSKEDKVAEYAAECAAEKAEEAAADEEFDRG